MTHTVDIPRTPACRWQAGRARLAGLALLVLALQWSALLGQAHRVLHVPAAGHAPAAALESHTGHAGPGLLEHLLSSDGEAPDCQLYDQLGQPLGLSLPVLPWLTPALPLFRATEPQRLLQVTACSPYAARAPPLSR